jgi:hypothetical protein
VLCLHPVGGLSSATWGTPLGVAKLAFGATVELEALALRRRGASVKIVTPDDRSATAMGGELMSVKRAGPAHAAGFEQGLALRARR